MSGKFCFCLSLCPPTFGGVQVGGIVSQAISRMENDVATRKAKDAQVEKDTKEKLKELEAKMAPDGPGAFEPSKKWMNPLRLRKLWKSKSTSFTRAPDW